MNNKIYISGPITGVYGWEERFMEAEERVEMAEFFNRYGSAGLYYKAERFGFVAVSPREFNAGLRYRKLWWYMVRCVVKMLGCSYVYMMRGWQYSRGARMENRWAHFMGKGIIYEEDMRCR